MRPTSLKQCGRAKSSETLISHNTCPTFQNKKYTCAGFGNFRKKVTPNFHGYSALALDWWLSALLFRDTTPAKGASPRTSFFIYTQRFSFPHRLCVCSAASADLQRTLNFYVLGNFFSFLFCLSNPPQRGYSTKNGRIMDRREGKKHEKCGAGNLCGN